MLVEACRTNMHLSRHAVVRGNASAGDGLSHGGAGPNSIKALLLGNSSHAAY